MSGFSAAVLPTLDWTLEGAIRQDGTPFGPEAKGVVPEPTEARLVAYYAALAATAGTPVDANDPEQVLAAVQKAISESFPAIRAALTDLCAGSPSAEIIAAMPPRLLGAFAGWLAGEVSPKG